MFLQNDEKGGPVGQRKAVLRNVLIINNIGGSTKSLYF